MSSGNTSDLPEFPFARIEGSYQPPEELERLRQQGPVCRIQLFDGRPVWIVTRHKEVCEMLKNKNLSNERYNPSGYPEIHPDTKKAGVKPTFVHMDDPKHASQRAMVNSFFTPAAVGRIKPHVQGIVDSLLDTIKQRGCDTGPVDLVDKFAAIVNPKVILTLFLNVPDDDANELIKSSSALAGTSGTASESGHTDLHDYLSRLIDQRIESPGEPENDLISKLVIEQYRPGNLDRDDIINLVYMILVAGNSAITSSIALGVLTLLQHQDQLNDLKENPGLAGQAVEEILRYHTPSALNSRRVATADLMIDGKKIKAGEGLIGSVRSADRDETVYPEPDKFDIHRNLDPHQNLAFGYGPHYCQGQWLSRLELEVVFNTLFRKMPNLRLAASPSKLEYTPLTQNVGLVHLPVLF